MDLLKKLRKLPFSKEQVTCWTGSTLHLNYNTAWNLLYFTIFYQDQRRLLLDFTKTTTISHKNHCCFDILTCKSCAMLIFTFTNEYDTTYVSTSHSTCSIFFPQRSVSGNRWQIVYAQHIIFTMVECGLLVNKRCTRIVDVV